MQQLSPHFTREEFEIDGPMPEEAVEICTKMCVEVLEALRQQFNEPYFITSGYRPLDVNQETGGVCNSEHVYTAEQCAADGYFRSQEKDMRPVFDWVRNSDTLVFDQVILEHGQTGDIVHVGLSDLQSRREALEGLEHGGSKTYVHWPVSPLQGSL